MATSKRPQRTEPPRNKDEDKAPAIPLRLIRTEADHDDGIALVFDAQGETVTWLLEQTSVLEFFALILQGKMREGQRIIVEGEVTLEPQDPKQKAPMLCFTGSPLQTCVPMKRPALKALRNEIDHVLSLRH